MLKIKDDNPSVIVDDKNFGFATAYWPSDAQFIARACNAHEGLVKALKGLIELYNTDEGCRSLPEYINATAALAAA